MTTDRIVQLVGGIVMALALTISGSMLPRILNQADESVLRYTNVSVEGAPPIVVVGTAIGALRGLVVDYLWLKANAMKEKGLFYEAMADADLITKLQPRFAQVWSFHGHNMTYNISVATHTQQERWEWVNAGIRLVRNEGLRYNPNDMLLHRELAFWLGHKIEGVSDDAHLYYKREFCREWHMLLGQPPEGTADHLAWIKEVADAPETLMAADRQTPGVAQLVEQLKANYPKGVVQEFRLDKNFLSEYTYWKAVKEQSAVAKLLNFEEEARKNAPFFEIFDKLASDPALQPQWKTLVAHVRKRVLLDEYNMDPQLMHQYELELKTPIEWRNAQAHALYWSRKGAEAGKGRLSEEDIYIALNNDSQQLQAMQDLARYGRMTFDPFATSELPGRFPEPRWIDTIDGLFEHFYKKHYEVRGQGGERFITFLQNFMSSAVCEMYRSGELNRAQSMLDKLDERFGRGTVATSKFKKPLDVFVHDETFDQYQVQPHLATRDIYAALRYGFRVGVIQNRPEVLRGSLGFVKQVTELFKGIHWNDYVTKFGEGRMADLIGEIEDSVEIGYLITMTDPQTPMQDRIMIWRNTDRVLAEATGAAPVLRALVYDRMMPSVAQQFASNELSVSMTVSEAFPEPPGLDLQRQALLQRQQERQRIREEIRKRDELARQQ